MQAHVAGDFEANEFAVLRAVHVAVRNDGPLFQVFFVDGFDDKAASRLAQKAELTRLVARKPLYRGCDEGIGFILALRFPKAGEHVIADADGRPFIAPRDFEQDARRRAVFVFIPVKRGGCEIAVLVLRANNDDRHLRQRVLAHPAPGVGDEAIGGKLFEHPLQADAICALDVEGSGDFAPPDVLGGGLNELKNVFLGRYFRARGFHALHF